MKKTLQGLWLAILLVIFIFNTGYSVERAEPKNKPKQDFVILTCGHTGMFWPLLSLLGALHTYESGGLAGLTVDYETNGPYYDPNYGPNWFSYYFGPIYVGSEVNAEIKKLNNGRSYEDWAVQAEFFIKKKDAHELVTKYLHVDDEIQTKVNSFVQNNFLNDFVIGVHYRGTNKWQEAPRASYESVVTHINDIIAEFNLRNYKIFLATDEQSMLDYLLKEFPSRVIYYKPAFRSIIAFPVHYLPFSGYKKGEDALIDCLLLSKTNILLKTTSNLSLFSTYFNPHIPVVHITTRGWGPLPEN